MDPFAHFDSLPLAGGEQAVGLVVSLVEIFRRHGQKLQAHIEVWKGERDEILGLMVSFCCGMSSLSLRTEAFPKPVPHDLWIQQVLSQYSRAHKY